MDAENSLIPYAICHMHQHGILNTSQVGLSSQKLGENNKYVDSTKEVSLHSGALHLQLGLPPHPTIDISLINPR